ncbi:uncharacterized protein DS421_5g152800 [Arachis hypogaea]|nr:uncharacterized protein DS421_5g152800 [Arachis hypogaea]
MASSSAGSSGFFSSFFFLFFFHFFCFFLRCANPCSLNDAISRRTPKGEP